ncbi:hypothetical protein [Arenibacter certesii]|uniref:Uncharacterized protein n=1 Tax=Arenibacter certesii TaxID=228955 RepID=A0A918MP65_9FLAO|nr:hypothetical protein [Arenibacter certesii]GGW45582.1 hypothetical protein GCM10007383_32480 [Arenibacter certesii]
MIWNNISGENLMEFCHRNISSYQNNYNLLNNNFINRNKIKNIRKKSDLITSSIINYFSLNAELELEDLYFTLKKSNSDFWDKLFFHCVALATTEILLEPGDFDIDKSTTRAIAIFTKELKDFGKFNDPELVSLKFDLIKEKIKMNLITIPTLFEK